MVCIYNTLAHALGKMLNKAFMNNARVTIRYIVYKIIVENHHRVFSSF